MTKLPEKYGENRLATRLAWLRWALSVLCALAVLGGFSSVARASCGDWLADPKHKMASQHSLLPGQDRPLPAPAPCKGPLCQKAPAGPSPVVPATVVEPVDKLGVAADTTAMDPLSEQSFLTAGADVHPSKGFLPRIEHPPRA